ncbi:MAG: nuclear transport factor 2 family protein [Candidatus Limnocylindrales bacterium]
MSKIEPAVAREVEISSADEAAIRGVIDDYYLGWYEGDGDRMARALHPDLAKRGWYAFKSDVPGLDQDTHATMVELARTGRGRQSDPAARRYTVDISDVYGDIGSAVVHAVPYVDYLHLVKTADGWQILNALWCPA